MDSESPHFPCLLSLSFVTVFFSPVRVVVCVRCLSCTVVFGSIKKFHTSASHTAALLGKWLSRQRRAEVLLQAYEYLRNNFWINIVSLAGPPHEKDIEFVKRVPTHGADSWTWTYSGMSEVRSLVGALTDSESSNRQQRSTHQPSVFQKVR